MPRFALFAAISLLASTASALSITNLDSEPHRVGIQSVGGAERVETIPASRTIYVQETRMWLFSLDSKNPHRIQANNDEKYTIWGDGELMIQKYMSQTTRGSR